MLAEEAFDSFYRATRQPLLEQTFALTGDLPAATAAVREGYVAAWHHWRKVSRLDDPAAWVRPRVWQLAQRRASARIFHRPRGLGPGQEATLQALGKLAAGPRRVVLLTELAARPLPEAARELGMTREVAERNLQAATAALATSLDVPSMAVRVPLLDLAGATSDVALPRPTIIRRAGRKRRNAHALVGSAVAVAAALASGTLAYQPVAEHDLAPGQRSSAAPDEPRQRTASAGLEEPAPTAGELLDADQIRRLGERQRWAVTATHDNTGGDGINTACQQQRFADPGGESTLVRTFEARGRPQRSAVQTLEVSRTPARAREAFDTIVGWYAGCRVARLQLLEAYRVSNVGDEAGVLLYRVWERPVTTYSVAVARIGRVTTTTVARSTGAAAPADQITQSLADAVAMVCGHSGSVGCAKTPAHRKVPPPPSGEERGILAVADLPPVGRIDQPWVGTDVGPARRNPAATTCDNADFHRAGARTTRTRTYLIPQAKLPARFGLTETYGVFRTPAGADRFLGRMRARVAGCEDRELSASVLGSDHERRTHRPAELVWWHLRLEVSDRDSVEFRVGFVRVGRAVAQVTFAPAPGDDVTARAFRDLLVRAGDRLRELPTTR